MPFDGIVTKAVTEELKEKITPGRINKIYQPSSTEIIFTIRKQRKNHTLILSIHPSYARFHLTNATFQNPEEPPMFCMLLRKHLSGAIIEAIEQNGMERIVTFHIKTRNEIGDLSTKYLLIELMGRHSNIMLVDENKEFIIDSLKHVPAYQNRYRTILPGSKYISPPPQNKLNPLTINEEQFIKKLDFNAGRLDKQIVQTLTGFSPMIARELVNRAHLGSEKTYAERFSEIQDAIINQAYQPAIYRNQREDFHVIPIKSYKYDVETFTSVNDMLDSFYTNKAERDRVKQQAKDMYRLINNEKDKNERKLKIHQKTLDKAKNASHYQKLGELLTANMHLVTKGDATVTVIDYYDPEQNEITINLKTDKTPSENAQHFFTRYRKLSQSKKIVKKEMIKARQEINYLEQLLQQIDTAREEDIEDIRDELRQEGYLKKQRKSKQTKRRKPLPEEFTASDGTTIYVGKNNKQNEYLTQKLAHRNDTWLHALDIPGSHVVIRSNKPSEETLLEAAHLAAYYSKASQSASVPVDYTKVRHVKKPSGAKPGFVTYDQQKTLFVTPDEALIKKLR